MLISYDTETFLAQPGLAAPPLACASIATPEPGSERLLSRAEALTEFRALLESGNTIVGANIAYDMAVMAAADPSLVPLIFAKYERNEVIDVLIDQALDAIADGLARDGDFLDRRTGGELRDPETGQQKNRFSLALCTAIELDRIAAKKDTWRLSYARLADLDLDQWPEDARAYPRADARNTIDVAAAHRARGARNLHDGPRQVRAALCGHLASVWGMRTDPARVAILDARVTRQHDEDRERFTKAGIYRAEGAINPETGRPWPRSQVGKKDTAVLKALVTKAYLGNPPLTEKGAVSTARDTLIESGDELLEALGQAGANEKLFTTYLPLLRTGTKVPINPGFNPLLATGRTSNYSPSLQTLPRGGGVRECFVPRAGQLFCSVDYGTLELATLAQVCLWLFGRSKLADALNADQDCHSRLGARIAGIGYDDFRARLKTGDKAIKNLRQLAKPINFGLPGGMGVPKLILTARKDGVRFCELAGVLEKCGVAGKAVLYQSPGGKEYPITPTCVKCLELAEEYKRLWFAEWEEMRPYFAWVSRQVEGEPCEITQFVSNRIRGGLGFCDGANTSFQGLAADGAKHALWMLSKECYTDRTSVLYGSRPVVFVHDEIIAEIPEDVASTAGVRMSKVMISAMREWVPDVTIKADPTLMRAWYKAAEPVWKDGRLQVWEPRAV